MAEVLKRNVVSSFLEGGWNYGTWGGPYHHLHQQRGAKYCVYNNRLMAVDQGGDRFEDAHAHLVEVNRAIVDEHGRLGAAAVDTERRDGAEAFDAKLPRVLVEAHDLFAPRRAHEICERPREVP